MAGLAAGSAFGECAVVLEQADRPGGLVRTPRINGWWFDQVIHVLYFCDFNTECRIRALLGKTLAPCRPLAWVETSAGRTRYPIQAHLSGLEHQTVIRAIRDFAEVTFGPRHEEVANFEQALLQAFGRGICEAFMFPYNEKLWKRPLSSLAPSAFQWNVERPTFEQALAGALDGENSFTAYNAAGWYPRPPRDAPVRGMEVLSRALADTVPDLRLEHKVTAVDVDSHTVFAVHRGQSVVIRYAKACSTLPLPSLLAICRHAPAWLREAARDLVWNRVWSAALCIRGPRPETSGHWCYYTDPTLVFNRLVFMHAFDPALAPDDGWGLTAEITELAEDSPGTAEEILARVGADVRRVGAVGPECEIVGRRLMLTDPAYVVFTPRTDGIVERAHEFLREHDIEPLGRYGRWEYSSMSQVMRDGFAWAERGG